MIENTVVDTCTIGQGGPRHEFINCPRIRTVRVTHVKFSSPTNTYTRVCVYLMNKSITYSLDFFFIIISIIIIIGRRR